MLHDFFAANPFRRIPLQARFKSGVAAVVAVVIVVVVVVAAVVVVAVVVAIVVASLNKNSVFGVF